MNITLEQAERIPLATDRGGVIRVAGTRVTLETVAGAFQDGATAEEIVQQYPSLSLADVYSVIGYILRHRLEVETYLQERTADHQTVQEENENRSNPKGIRARLLARQG